MTKLSIKRKYLIGLIFIIFIMIGIMIIGYNYFAVKYFISENKIEMNNFYQRVKTMNLSELSTREQKEITDFTEEGFRFSFMNENDIVDGYIDTDLYSETPKAKMSKDDELVLLGKIQCNDSIYYVDVAIKLSTVRNMAGKSVNFLFLEMLAILMVCIPLSVVIARRTVKPILELNDMTIKLEEGNLTEEENYTFGNDEVGNLAASIREMHQKISSDYNEISNYNYLLKTQNEEFVEFDKRRREFINKAAHELKTPLAIISAQIEMMHMDNEEAMSEYYESIIEEIQHMSELIRGMLKGSFDEKINKEIELKKFNLSKLINHNEDRYISLFTLRNINVEFQIEDGIYINGNKEYILQAMNNYISNAYEKSPENEKVTISLKEEKDKAIFSVHNTGTEIPEEEIEKIWNMFHSNEKETANVGLGLYIVRDIVKLHGGKCYAINEEDGVRFVIEIDVV